MTTVWRPRVRIPVPDIDGADADENRRDESTKKGTKRKGTKRKGTTKHRGPCKHGVKYRSNCKVCSACPHGRQRFHCKECGGSGICEHGRQRSQCKECGGSQICEHGRERSKCKECGGASICEHGRERYQCKECGGASDLRARSSSALSARSAVGHKSASTVVSALVQGVRWVSNMRARSSALSMQGVPRGETVVVVVFSIYYKQYTAGWGSTFCPESTWWAAFSAWRPWSPWPPWASPEWTSARASSPGWSPS